MVLACSAAKSCASLPVFVLDYDFLLRPVRDSCRCLLAICAPDWQRSKGMICLRSEARVSG